MTSTSFSKGLGEYTMSLYKYGHLALSPYTSTLLNKTNLKKWSYIKQGKDGFEMFGYFSVKKRGDRMGSYKFEKIMALSGYLDSMTYPWACLIKV